MKHAFFSNLLMLLRNCGQTGLHLTRKMFYLVRRLSWPQMALAAVGLLAAVIILHVALFLFIVFMLFKLVLVAALAGGARNGPHAHQPRRQPRRQGDEPYTIDM